MRDFGGKSSTTWSGQQRAADPGLMPGKRTLTEMLPTAGSGAPVQRKAEAGPAPGMPAAPRPTIDALFGGAQRRAGHTLA